MLPPYDDDLEELLEYELDDVYELFDDEYELFDDEYELLDDEPPDDELLDDDDFPPLDFNYL